MDFDFDTETISPETGSVISIGGPGSLRIPIGTTAERPFPSLVGMVRWSTSNSNAEIHDGLNWNPLITNVFGTTNQVTVVGSGPGVTLSTPSVFIAPGSLEYSTHTGNPIQSLAATGTTQATAALVTLNTVVVSAGSANSGIRLQTPTLIGQTHTVINKTAVAIQVYPQVGGSFASGAVNNYCVISAGRTLSIQWDGSAWSVLQPNIIAGAGVGVSYSAGDITITNSGLITVADDTTTATAFYPTMSTITSGTLGSVKTSSSKLSFKPSTGALSVEKLISTGTYAATTDTKPNLHIDNLGNITRVEKEETNLYDISTHLVSGIYNLTLADRDRILYCEGGLPFEVVVPDAMPDGFTFYVFTVVLDCFVTTTSPEYFIGAGGLEIQETLLVEPYCVNVYKNFGSLISGVWYSYTQNSSTNRHLNYSYPTFDPLVDDDIFLVKIGGPTTIDGARATTFGEMKSGMEGTFAKGSNSGTTTTIGTATTDIVTTTGQLVAEGSYTNTADLRANLAIDALGNIKRITKESFALKDISASVVLNAYEVQPEDRDAILVGPYGDSVDYTLPATLPDGFSVSFFSFASGTVTPVNVSEIVLEAGVQLAESGRLEPYTIKTFLKVANEPDSIWYGYALGSSPANSVHYSYETTTLDSADYISATDVDGMGRNKITVADLTAQMTASINMPVLAGAAPTSGVQLFGSSIAGREIPAFRGTTGLATTVQSSLMRKRLSRWAPVGNGVNFGLDGVVALTATGTATASNVAATNRYTWQKRVEYLVTTAATTAVAGWRYSAVQWGRGANAGDGGFFMVCRFGIATGTSVSTRRCFVGMRNSVAAPTDVNPSTQVNCIGVGYDAADAQLQIMHNDASGACTKIALGASFPRPSTDRTSCYELALYCAPAGTTVGYEVTNLITGEVANGTMSTDLPATTTLLAPLGYSSVGGTSGVTGITLMSLGIETDY